MRIRFASRLVTLLVAAAALAACESSDPAENGLSNGGGGGASSAATCDADQGRTVLDAPSCKALATDYSPANGSKDDAWAACVSDDGAYHPFNASVGSNARIAAFDEISALLGFGGLKVPTPQDFLDAKVAYSQPEGLQSRVARREDTHYPPLEQGGKEVACNAVDAAVWKAHPDRCVSQAQIQPLIEAALNDGAKGVDPVMNAARVEAGLLWFSYVSVFKEIETCGTEDKEDCDSATGYYGGVQTRENPIGFGKYVKALSPQAHDRVWDGFLAVRCWRDLDQAMPLGNVAMREQAQQEVDRATLRGLALIVRERLQNAPGCGVAAETFRVLGKVLLRAAKERDAAKAATLEAEVAKADASTIDVKAATDAIDALFPCP
jgi:hypothetical protein